ncbi:MAG: DUF2062 domain-containing protein, partial [Kiritimatiellia bacterium]|nr:DUF2062 domain-containing protein [Kiritimatiellia bacterium]
MSGDGPDRIWCVIPVFNNASTVKSVALRCREWVPRVLVVDDGSTDADLSALFADTGIEVLSHPVNRGKGAALVSALSLLRQRGAEWMITLDADGQHDPADLPFFLARIAGSPPAILVGARDFSAENVPASSRFGRWFSNLWIRIECGARVADSQSGFRAYPVPLVSQMKIRGRRFDFEVEILVKAVWYGLKLQDIPIRVFYAPGKSRITHFHKGKDNLRLTHRHGMLMSRRLLPWPHPKLIRTDGDARELIRHPLRFLMRLLRESASPALLGCSAGVGVLVGALPLVGAHMMTTLFVASRLRLNRVLALTTQNLCMPPLVPVACFVLGHAIRNGRLISLNRWREFPVRDYFIDWLLGSLVLAPILGLLVGLVIYH